MAFQNAMYLPDSWIPANGSSTFSVKFIDTSEVTESVADIEKVWRAGDNGIPITCGAKLDYEGSVKILFDSSNLLLNAAVGIYAGAVGTFKFALKHTSGTPDLFNYYYVLITRVKNTKTVGKCWVVEVDYTVDGSTNAKTQSSPVVKETT